MIKPTVGRVVWFHPGARGVHLQRVDPQQPLAAIVTHVESDTQVNLSVFDSNGNSHGFTGVRLQQPEDPPVQAEDSYCEWMPYQKGQAAKTEQLEGQLAAGN